MGKVPPTSDASPPTTALDDGTSRSNGLRTAATWLIICLLIFLWWASAYDALVEVSAEWQFALLGRYFPSLTVILAVLAFALPIAAMIGWQRRRRRRQYDADVGVDSKLVLLRVIQSANRGRLFFLAVAIVAAIAAAAVFLSMLWLPPSEGPVRTIVGIEGSVQPQGPAAYARPFRIGRVARIEENIGFFRRVLFVAPVYLPRQHDGEGLLTTVDPLPTPPLRFAPIKSGVLVERGLPGELTNLYHNAGIEVPDRSYLLMRDGATVRWRALALGIQTTLLALLSLGISLLFRRQGQRLTRVIEKRNRSTPV